MRDNSAYICGTTDGLILDCFTPVNYNGMTTAVAVIGLNISDFLSPSALINALSVLSYVERTKRRFRHGFIMRFDGRIINRIITLFPGNEPDTIVGFIKSLRVKYNLKTVT